MHGIGEASARSGVKIETIRYYEREGVVPVPGRSSAGRRVYTGEEIARLRFVRRCRDLGFSMPNIKAFFLLSSSETRPCGDVKAMAQGRLAEVEAKIESLIALRGALRSLSANCDAGKAVCPMLSALMTVDAD